MRPVDRQISEERALYREEFPFILEDLRRLAGAGPVIAEGAALLPALFDECEIPDRRCVWIVPTETFQRARYAQREWRHDVLTSCTDPEQAWKNWLDRDAGFARSVVQDAQRRNRRVMIVDSQTVDAMIDDVVSWFELSP